MRIRPPASLRGPLATALLATLCACVLAGPGDDSRRPAPEPVDEVDPFIGTRRQRWFYFAPAALPFGMVKLAPDTSGFGGYGGGGNRVGYDPLDGSILGFSLVHEFQLGAFLFMPTTGPLVTVPGDAAGAPGFRSRFRRDSERARPGYYRVFLEDPGVEVELTATQRAGVHRYRFPRSPASHVLVDVGHLLGEAGMAGDAVIDASVAVLGPSSMSASVTFQPSYATRPVSVHLAASFSRPFTSSGVYRDGEAYPGVDRIRGPGIGFYADFETEAGEAITVAAGISYVSVEQARLNLDTEVGARSFDAIAASARKAWNDELGRLEVQGGSPADRTKLYTALWHVLLGRGIAQDVDGAYRDAAGEVRRIPFRDGAPAFDRFNSDSLWGAHWTLGQVWGLLYPARMDSYARFMLDVYQDAGWLPDGYVPSQYVAGMPSNHATSFLASAMMRGIPFDHELALEAIRKNQDETRDRPVGTGNEVLGPYLEHGYAPYEAAGYGPTAHTLEYAYEDWCASQVAERLGRPEDAARWAARSRNWLNVFDPASRMFWPRSADGSWLEGYTPMSGQSFGEGNAWQYLWFVPQDIPGLMERMGPALFLERLAEVFREADARDFSAGDENTSGYYALRFNPGNETDLHAPWLFNLAGAPDRTQYYNRRLLDSFFGTTPEKGYGAGQDEDQGQLGAWFVLLATGLFDVQGGCAREPQLQVASPLFDRVTFHLDPAYYPGGDFVVTARRSTPGALYVRSARLNGALLPGLAIDQRAVLAGGELELDLE